MCGWLKLFFKCAVGKFLKHLGRIVCRQSQSVSFCQDVKVRFLDVCRSTVVLLACLRRSAHNISGDLKCPSFSVKLLVSKNTKIFVSAPNLAIFVMRCCAVVLFFLSSVSVGVKALCNRRNEDCNVLELSVGIIYFLSHDYEFYKASHNFLSQ